MAYKSVIAENVRNIIDSRGLKHCAVAQKAGYSRAAFSSMLCGRKVIAAEDIPRLADALGVDYNTLFAKGDDPGS